MHYIQALRPFLHGLEDNWLWLMGLVLMVDPLLDSLWSDYRAVADRYVSRKVRTRTSWTIAIGCVFIAVFLAFADQLRKTEIAIGQRDEARHQTPPIQQSTIDRLSGDLTGARGQIDAQAKIIDQQEKEIERQNQEILGLKPKPNRHLTDDDRQRLVAVFEPIKDQFPELQISAPEDGEPQGYAKEFANEFNVIGIKVPSVGIVFATNAETAPLQVVVKDLNKIPQEAVLFEETMQIAKFTVVGATMDTLGDDQFIFVVGSKR